KILQVANSAYYGLARQVSSIRSALLLLGAYTIRGITLSVAAVAVLRLGRAVCETEQQLWRHAFLCAGYAQGIAQASRWGTRVAEDAYIAGLLHDIGSIFLLARFPTLYRPLWEQARQEPERFLERELHTFGCDHADVGAMIADHWQLPARIVQAIGHHHAPFLPDSDYRWLAAAVMQADAWDAESFSPLPQDLCTLIRLPDEVSQQIRQRVGENLDALSQILFS
ncbi:MAG: HDOD domain-containing protein, partial [Fimbriimonadales bacterium]